jgi:hypothetical protein
MNDDRRIALGIFLLAAVAFAWFYGGDGWNQNAQFDLTRALVERGTLFIDGYEGNTGDSSVGADGHRYVNRAPGVSFLAAIPYVFVRNEWFCTAATCGVCGALIGAILYLEGRRRYDARPRDALAIALAVLFGTIVFAYSTMLFVHVPAALFLLLAFVLWERRPLAAGAAAGMATMCFYVCGAAALWMLIVRPSRRFIAGGAPFALLLGAYHWACFGSPFRTAVESSQFTERGLLFGVLRLPQIEALVEITVSPYRGLFFASPFLLLALFGLRRMPRRERTIVDVVVAVFIVAVASFNGWNGGWSFSARYLVPIVPLLAIPMLAAAREAPKAMRAAWIAAAAVSIAINFVATAVDPMPVTALRNPIVQYEFPVFVHGRIPAELRRGFPWYFKRDDVGAVAVSNDAANLGERIFGKGRRASVLPIALWIVGGSAVLFAAASRRDRGVMIAARRRSHIDV